MPWIGLKFPKLVIVIDFPTEQLSVHSVLLAKCAVNLENHCHFWWMFRVKILSVSCGHWRCHWHCLASQHVIIPCVDSCTMSIVFTPDDNLLHLQWTFFSVMTAGGCGDKHCSKSLRKQQASHPSANFPEPSTRSLSSSLSTLYVHFHFDLSCLKFCCQIVSANLARTFYPFAQRWVLLIFHFFFQTIFLSETVFCGLLLNQISQCKSVNHSWRSLFTLCVLQCTIGLGLDIPALLAYLLASLKLCDLLSGPFLSLHWATGNSFLLHFFSMVLL